MAASDKHPGMITHSQDPLNLETPLSILGDDFETPNAAFYVRNHGTIPRISPDEYRLAISGLVEAPLELSWQELRERFPYKTIEATLHCAGNRRDELAKVAPIPGELPWGPGAIGNACWGGVSLAEVLRATGIKESAQHVTFVGLDKPYEGDSLSFGGSIPLHKAMGSEVLLAYEMNGAPLPEEHGFPLRVIVPGYVGARSVKWLSSITLQEFPSKNHFQAQSYRLFPPYVSDEGAAEASKAFPLGEISVNTVICQPQEGERLPVGDRVRVRGVAVAGGGRSVERIDLTSDGGQTWAGAKLAGEDIESPWAWRRWEAELRLAPGTHHIAARALDSGADTQPEDAASLWNIKGYVNNAWHRMELRVQ